VTQALANRAMLLAETHGLRGYDAMQLAAGLELNDRILLGGLAPIVLISADSDLNAAAILEGLLGDNPSGYP